MKLLIGYDGSRSADEALKDLRCAGLPETVEALLFAVAEIWMPPPKNGHGAEEYLSADDPDWIERHEKVKHSALKEAESLCRHARQNLKKMFPEWRILSATAAGSPARKILEKAEEFNPDLIVTGAQGRSAVSRLFFGSISRKILAEARCSVRVARAPNEKTIGEPCRIIIGFDGSPGARAAVQTVAARKWRQLCEIRLVTVVDPLVPDNIGRFMTPGVLWVEEEMRYERQWIKKMSHSALLKLKSAASDVELVIRDGNPKQILIEEAINWNADCIFLGANQYQNKLEKFVVGSVAEAVTERARCSVEAVRKLISL